MIKSILLWKAGSSLKRVWMTVYHLKPSPSASTKTALRSQRKSATTSTLKKQALTDVLLMIACTGKDAPGPVSALSVSKNRNVPHDAVSAEGSLPSRKDCLTFKIGSADRQISALLTEFLLFEVLGSMDIGIDGRG